MNKSEAKFVSDGVDNYVVVPLSFAAGNRILVTTHTIEIDGDTDPPAIKTTPKYKFKIGPNDAVVWTCRKNFIVRFLNGKGPDAGTPATLFEAKADASGKFSTVPVVFAGHAHGTELGYEALVQIDDKQWVSADPSIIIDENKAPQVLVKV